MNSPELIIIDLDDTLYSYAGAHEPAIEKLHNFLSNALNLPITEVSKKLAEARISVKERLGEQASAHSRLLYLADFFRIIKRPVKPSFLLEAESIYWREYFVNMKVFYGAVDFLINARLLGCRIVLVTDLNLNIQLRKLLWLQLDQVFDHVISSEETSGDKPTGQPERFLQKYLDELNFPITASIWTIGDKDHDNLLQDRSVFFKKITEGKIRQNANKSYEFSNFTDLFNLMSN